MRCVLAVLLALSAAGAHGATPRAVDPATCLPALDGAERGGATPGKLLRTIALVESGRPDPATGRVTPWAWTVTANGAGRSFPTKEAAMQAAQALLAAGTQSIDVGCMQVNLAHHPGAFPSLDQAFDPQANVAYAARFLRALFQQAGSWPKAAAAYHSQTPDIGAEYGRRVMALWPLAPLYADPVTPPGPRPNPNHSPAFAAWLRRNAGDAASAGGRAGARPASDAAPCFICQARPR